jgi:hypothetical protein
MKFSGHPPQPLRILPLFLGGKCFFKGRLIAEGADDFRRGTERKAEIRTTGEERLMSRKDHDRRGFQDGIDLFFSKREVVKPYHAENRAGPWRTILALNAEQYSLSTRQGLENRIVLVPLCCALG